MTIATLTTFFMWCTIINGGILFLWALLTMFAPDLVYRTQTYFFPLTREQFNVLIYSFLGLFKVFFMFFNLGPWLALLIMN